MESKLNYNNISDELMFTSLYVFGRINISQGVTSSGESTFGRNDRTEFLRALLCYLRPLSILFVLNSQGKDDRKQFRNVKK